MTKPTRVLLYFILLVLLSLPLGAFADAQVSSEYEYYVDTDNKAILTKYLGSKTIVKVPSKIDGYPVKATERTFADNHALEKVVIPNGITSIGTETFLNCNNLKRVRISKTVEELGERAFLGTGLTRLTLPETTWHIGKACFYACTELKFVKATADQLVIEPYAFFKSGIEGLQTSREPSYAASSFSHVCEFYYNSTTAFVMRHEPVRLIAGFLSRCPLPLRALYVLIFAILAALFLCLLTLFFVRIGRVIGKDKLKIYNEYNAQCAGIVSLTDDSAIIRNKVVPTRLIRRSGSTMRSYSAIITSIIASVELV